jgi:hypothetical protein
MSIRRMLTARLKRYDVCFWHLSDMARCRVESVMRFKADVGARCEPFDRPAANLLNRRAVAWGDRSRGLLNHGGWLAGNSGLI